MATEGGGVGGDVVGGWVFWGGGGGVVRLGCIDITPLDNFFKRWLIHIVK